MFSDDALKTNHRRLLVLLLLLTFGFAVIIGQLVRYQIVLYAPISKKSDQQVIAEHEVRLDRGRIVDRNGNVLALDLVRWDITASPDLFSKAQAEQVASQLAGLLNLPEDELLAKLTTEADWVQIDKNAPEEAGEKVAELISKGQLGLKCVPIQQRTYPQGELTAQLVGIVNDTRVGFYGVEGYYNDELEPVVGKTLVERYPTGAEMPSPPLRQSSALEGNSVVLTVDLNIQYIVADELQKALDKFSAESGSAVVMDPRTGAILASVSLPSFDPSDFANTNELGDPVVSDMWEPGSIFKIITWAGGLDSGTITPSTMLEDKGVIEVGGRLIVNSDRSHHGWVTPEEGLLHSLNTIAATISTRMGKDQFYGYLRRFGFGNLTGVDLASEGSGHVKRPGDSDWFPSDLGTNAFGQGVAVTPIQMISAASAIANKGLLMRPYVVKEYVEPSLAGQPNRVVRITPMAVRQVISPETAQILTQMLGNVVERSSSKARVPGYRVAGKTGTAQIPTPLGYDPVDSIQSYVGYAPADDPQFIVLVKLDKPNVNWAADSAAPAFSAIAQRLLAYLQIPPDEIRLAQQSGE